jgi:transposase InsO family protein
MKDMGLVCRVRMKKYKSYKGEVGKVAPNLLERNFETERPNQKWVTDVTECSLFGQKLYLSPILDLYSRDIVSFSISDKPILSLVTDMLDKAFAQIPDGTKLILHSDQGVAVHSTNNTKECCRERITQCMTYKGNC